jgi:hypothetical protein
MAPLGNAVVEVLKGVDLTGWPSLNLSPTVLQLTQFSQRWVGPVARRSPDPANPLFLLVALPDLQPEMLKRTVSVGSR